MALPLSIGSLKLVAMKNYIGRWRKASQGASIQDLSEDLILNIMTRLSLRDFVNLSFASKHWLHLPGWVERIPIDMDKVCPENKDSFIKEMNYYVHHYFKLRSKLEVPLLLHSFFYIHCCLSRDNSEDIDSWITMAICNGFTSLEVRSVCGLHINTDSPDDKKYIFPWQKLQDLPTALRRLFIRASIFQCCLTSKWILLQILDLYRSVISEDDVDKIVFCFPNLRILAFKHCKVPARLTIRNGSLTYLTVWDCRGLEQLDILDVKTLATFRFLGKRTDLGRISSPTTLSLGFIDVKGDDYVFQNLCGDNVTSLSIFRDRERSPLQSALTGRMNPFLWLEELKLYNHPTYGTSRQTMIDILKACPILESLHMVPSCTTNDYENIPEIYPVQDRHKSLKYITISGFCGSSGNMEMIHFLIQATKNLSHIVVQSKVERKEYMHPNHSANWHGEQEPEAVKQILLKSVKSEQLTFRCAQKNIVETDMSCKQKRLLQTLCGCFSGNQSQL